MSEEILAMISETVCEMVEQSKCDVRSVRERICEHVDEDSFNLAVYDFEVVITERIMQRIKETEIGDLIAEHLIEQLNNAISSSFLGKMIGDSVVERFGTAISTSVDKYIDENGESFISNVVRTELFNMCETPVSNVINRIESSGYDILEAVIEVYKHFVEEKAYSAIKGLDIGAIAADSIRAMDNKELECLVMSAMKTELGAVVNLGALIGFVLGLINMTFYLL